MTIIIISFHLFSFYFILFQRRQLTSTIGFTIINDNEDIHSNDGNDDDSYKDDNENISNTEINGDDICNNDHNRSNNNNDDNSELLFN